MSVSCPAFFMERRKYGPVKNQIRPIYRKYLTGALGRYTKRLTNAQKQRTKNKTAQSSR